MDLRSSWSNHRSAGVHTHPHKPNSGTRVSSAKPSGSLRAEKDFAPRASSMLKLPQCDIIKSCHDVATCQKNKSAKLSRQWSEIVCVDDVEQCSRSNRFCFCTCAQTGSVYSRAEAGRSARCLLRKLRSSFQRSKAETVMFVGVFVFPS